MSGASATIIDPLRGTPEVLRYLDGSDGVQLFTAFHQAKGEARAALLLCGPIGAERERSHRTLVEFARGCAAEGVHVLRFDYRGIGESGGRFEDHCLSDWRDDIKRCADLLTELAPNLPLALWGVRAGALLVSELFAEGLGTSAMCCAAADGQPHLQDVLRRTLVADMMARPHAKRTTREEIIASLEEGGMANVDGYRWSRRLWTDAADHRVRVPSDRSRALRVVDLRGVAKCPLPAEWEAVRETETSERFWESSPMLVPRSGALLERMQGWLRSSFGGGSS
jgi:alpha/beta superfamily hydrolase